MQDLCLHEGFIATQDLAAWFGLAYSTFRKKSAQKYEELKEYCKFEKVHGGAVIHEIYYGIYVSKNNSQYLLVKKYVQVYWRREEFESAVRVTALIKQYCPDVTITEGTCARYVSKARRELWPDDTDKPGELGGAFKRFVKMYRGDTVAENRYEALTDKEKEIQHQIREKYFPKVSVEVQDDVLNDYYNRQIDGDTAMNKITGVASKEEGKKRFAIYLEEVAATLKCSWLVRATYVKDGVYYVQDLDENGIPHIREVQVTSL